MTPHQGRNSARFLARQMAAWTVLASGVGAIQLRPPPGALAHPGRRWSEGTLVAPGGASSILAQRGGESLRGVRAGSAETGPLILAHQGHVAASVAWSPDGRSLASEGFENGVGIWDTASGRLRFRIDMPNPRSTDTGRVSVRSVAWNPKRAMIAAGDDAGQVRLYNPDDGTALGVLDCRPGFALCLKWSPDGAHLASSGWDGTIHIWDLSGKQERVIKNSHMPLSSVAWRPDGKALAAARSDGSIRIWDATGRDIASIKSATEFLAAVAWSPDGERIAASGADAVIRLWKVSTRKQLQALYAPRRHGTALAWSTDGRHLASGGWDKTVRLWDPASGILEHVFRGGGIMVEEVAWSPDGRRLAAGGWGSRIAIWDVAEPLSGAAQRAR